MSGQIHHVPGRLRLRLPRLRQCAVTAAQVSAAVRLIDGVIAAEANTVTGGLLIHYNAAAAGSQRFWDAVAGTLAAYGLSGQVGVTVPTVFGAGAPSVADRVCGTLVEKLIERSALALVTSLL